MEAQMTLLQKKVAAPTAAEKKRNQQRRDEKEMELEKLRIELEAKRKACNEAKQF
jgi:hypothetical protein